MQAEHHHSHHGCGSQSRGPEIFYGYCHETNRMRMMDFTDYLRNVQTGYSNLYRSPASAMQSMLDALSSMAGGATAAKPAQGKQRCGCGHDDCACACCIRCADIVEYALCGEVRRIPITFDNDTRRERDVTLQLANFALESGQEVGWEAALSDTEFKLPPCGEKTVLLTVRVDCGKLGSISDKNQDRQPTVDSCKVAYTNLRAEGCTIRPLVIAVAVLPEHCGAHHASCGCGCCN